MIPERNPTETRRRILQTAADEIYRNGFQAAGISEILGRSGLSKGAVLPHATRLRTSERGGS